MILRFKYAVTMKGNVINIAVNTRTSQNYVLAVRKRYCHVKCNEEKAHGWKIFNVRYSRVR